MDDKKKLTELQRECIWTCTKLLEPINDIPSCREMRSMIIMVLQDAYYTNDAAQAKNALCNLTSEIVKIRRALEAMESPLYAVQREITNAGS